MMSRFIDEYWTIHTYVVHICHKSKNHTPIPHAALNDVTFRYTIPPPPPIHFKDEISQFILFSTAGWFQSISYCTDVLL